MEIIAIANHKGGCGKTTTAINLAYALSQQKQKVLLIDLDPQGHATLGLNIDPDRLERSIFDLLTPRSKLKPEDITLYVHKDLDLWPSNMRLAFLEQLLSGKKQREYRLRQALESVSQYKYIIIDTAPALGLLTVNALLAANKVIVPVEPSNFALHGLQKLEETIELLEKKLYHQLNKRYLLTLLHHDSQYSKDFEKTLRSHCQELFHNKVSFSDIYKDASTLGLPVPEYKKDHPVALEYPSLAKEVLRWAKNKKPIYISSLPKPANNLLNIQKNKNDYFKLLQKNNSQYKYNYVVDTNGNISVFKLNNLKIAEKIFN